MYANDHSMKLLLIKTSWRDISQSPQIPQPFPFLFFPFIQKTFFQNFTHTRPFLGSAGVFPHCSGKAWNTAVHAGSSWNFCDPDAKCDTSMFNLICNRNLETRVMVSCIIFLSVHPHTALYHKRTVRSSINISFLKLIFDGKHIK